MQKSHIGKFVSGHRNALFSVHVKSDINTVLYIVVHAVGLKLL